MTELHLAKMYYEFVNSVKNLDGERSCHQELYVFPDSEHYNDVISVGRGLSNHPLATK